MIAFIKGNLINLTPNKVIIETGNIGYEINISHFTYNQLKDKKEYKLFTYLQIKEDSHTLYGFISQSEKKFFIFLISVKGVGPSAALSIISEITLENLVSAIIERNHVLIKSVKGIGEKTAKRIILELRDKLKKIEFNDIIFNEEIDFSKHNQIMNEASRLLIKLGLTKSNSEKIIAKIIKKEGNNVTVEKVVKEALISMGKV